MQKLQLGCGEDRKCEHNVAEGHHYETGDDGALVVAGAVGDAVLDRKITAELAPKHDENDGDVVERETQSPNANPDNTSSQTIRDKKSLVAEPFPMYRPLRI